MGVHIPKFAYKFVQKMMLDLKAYDSETYAHCVRGSERALRVSEELGQNRREQAIAAYSGLLHDLGKMKIPLEILNKPDRLTAEEFEIVKKHAEWGADLIAPLQAVPFFKDVSSAIWHHHERVDGQGYYGVPGDRIPFCSKIILVVDTVDAMTQDRAYRKGVSFDAACEELIRCSGSQFETQVVDAFFDAFDEKRSRKTGIAA